MTYTLGVDIGTFESKGVLADQEGRVVAAAARPHKMIVPQPGWAEHRADEDWWGDFASIARELTATVDPGGIDCVAVSAIGPCMLPTDSAGRPLTNGVLYGVDTRAAREIEDLTARLGAATILERGGNALTSQSVGPKILWLRRNRPEVFARASKVMTSTSYLVFRLTDEVVIDHHTAASFSPLYDAARMDWADDLAEGIIGREALPRLAWSTDIAGQVTPEAAAETGLAPGTPVTVGTVDAAAEAASVGVSEPGDMMLMYGSTVFTILIAEARLRDPRLWHAPWLFPGRHAAMAGLATSGTLTHWFRDRIGRELPETEAFARLAEEASDSPPGARGLMVLPYFSGERTPIHDPAARGVFFGLDLTHTRGDMYRALIEGIAFATAHVMDAYREAGAAPARVAAVGGGTKNRLWLQATSDVTGEDQILCGKTVGASYGDAFLAALAVGAAEPGDIKRWNPVAERVRAEPREVYARRGRLYRRLYERTKDLMAELSRET